MKPQSILIVDQQEVIRDSLNIVLSEEGFMCFEACSAAKAQKVLTTKRIDLILVDSHLLDHNGLFHFLKARFPKVKIIMMSSYVEIEVTQKALVTGAHDFVVKPLDFIELIDKVNFHLSAV